MLPVWSGLAAIYRGNVHRLMPYFAYTADLQQFAQRRHLHHSHAYANDMQIHGSYWDVWSRRTAAATAVILRDFPLRRFLLPRVGVMG